VSDQPGAAAVAGVALVVVLLGTMLVPGAFGRDENDVDWPPFHLTYETKNVSEDELATSSYELDYTARDKWILSAPETGEERRPTMEPVEAPSSWLAPVRYTDVAIATTKGMVRRDLPDGTIELVQTLELPCPSDARPELLRCLPGRNAVREVTTTHLGEHRLPQDVTVEYDGRLVGGFHATDVDWR
jgi:hypothetical protein